MIIGSYQNKNNITTNTASATDIVEPSAPSLPPASLVSFVGGREQFDRVPNNSRRFDFAFPQPISGSVQAAHPCSLQRAS